MANQRKPAKLLERAGAFRKNPSRRRTDARGRGELPNAPPAGLTKRQAALWRRVIAKLPPDIATGSDEFALARLVVLLDRANHARHWTAAWETQLRCYFNAFGFHPSARAALGGGGKEEKKNPFEEFRSPAGGSRA